MSAPECGQVLIGNRYRLEERVGAGAMGVVWRAVDELLGRTVAVKELLAVLPGAGGQAIEESRQRILREGRIAARLQHPNVISMFDVVLHEDRPWLVMEYLASESLGARVARCGRLPAAEVAEIGRQVADGLAAAHLAGVVHRDVKPGNVLLAGNGLVKLTDFGVSRAVDDVQLTRTGVIAGTPAYLAPEVAQGRDPTAASDVFALGATLYAAVEGTPPFGLDDNAYALLHKVATSEPEPPRHAGPLAGVLTRLLNVDPAGRPSAAQARDLLAAVAAGHVESEAAAPSGLVRNDDASTATDRPRRKGADDRFRRRRGSMLLGLLLALLVLGGGATIATLTASGSVAAPPPAGPPAPATSAPPPAGPPAPVTSTLTPAAQSPAAKSPAAGAPRRSPAPATSPAPSPRPSPARTGGPAADSARGTDPVTFVEHYYALLPGNTDAAFALLGPQARAQAGGAAGFAGFYARMRSVTVSNTRLVGDNTVDATVRFVQKDGTTSNEPYRFDMTTDGSGRMIMESFTRL